MAFQYHIHCPYCDHLLETTTTLSTHNDRMIKTCPLCARPYADPYGEEIALEPFQPSSVRSCLTASVFVAIVLAFIPCLAVLFITEHVSFSVTAFLICAALFLFLYLLRSLLSLRKEQQEQRTAWEESDRRLRDPSYATLLKQAGWYIPGRYLPCSDPNFNPEPISVKPVRIIQTKISKG